MFVVRNVFPGDGTRGAGDAHSHRHEAICGGLEAKWGRDTLPTEFHIIIRVPHRIVVVQKRASSVPPVVNLAVNRSGFVAYMLPSEVLELVGVGIWSLSVRNSSSIGVLHRITRRVNRLLRVRRIGNLLRGDRVAAALAAGGGGLPLEGRESGVKRSPWT